MRILLKKSSYYHKIYFLSVPFKKVKKKKSAGPDRDNVHFTKSVNTKSHNGGVKFINIAISFDETNKK